ncbi:MAG: PQQ-like beta-propeller repeat protein [Fuerstiella sp.]
MLCRRFLLMIGLSLGLCHTSLPGADWTRFRGPNGSGISPDSVAPPTRWSDTENLRWKAELPGPGLSCPIVIGDRVILTCWTGYADGSEDEGALESLKRNVLCLDRNTGDTLWSHAEPAVLPEDQYSGMFAQNGYASHTPVTDGERVYVFYGKTGVLAFDLGDGRKLWQKSVGENRERRGWGSASSPIVSQNLVIVPAFVEGDALMAFDGPTGELVWKQEVAGYTSNWSTPILVETGGNTELVLSVPGEVWGLNPENGKLRWYCELPGADDARASVIAHDDVVIAMAAGRGSSASMAVRAGGKGDVSESHRLWQGRDASGIATPVIHDGRLIIVDNKVLTTVDLKTGERLKQTRLTGGSGGSGERPDSGRGRPGAGDDEPGERPRRENSAGRPGGSPQEGGRPGGGRGYGGGVGGRDYSSPVIAGDHLYYASRSGDVYVFELGDEIKQVARNRFASDSGEYNATPAISDGELFIRSTTAVYCVAEKQ